MRGGMLPIPEQIRVGIAAGGDELGSGIGGDEWGICDEAVAGDVGEAVDSRVGDCT